MEIEVPPDYPGRHRGAWAVVDALARDWRSFELSPARRAMLGYAEKLTRDPGSVRRDDVDELREAGLDDEAVLHLCEVVAYFNFVNRTADGLGVTLEPDWPHPVVGERSDGRGS